MEDTFKKLFFLLTRRQEQNKFRHLQTDGRSASASHPRFGARPHITLKARMLGGQAETIMRQGVKCADH